MTHLIPMLHSMADALRRRHGPAAGLPAPEPLDHPALRRMSLRELADLPLPRPAPRQDGNGALGPGHDPIAPPLARPAA